MGKLKVVEKAFLGRQKPDCGSSERSTIIATGVSVDLLPSSQSGEQQRRRMILNLDQEWKYRAEGNANLVLALPDSRQVLRLKKVDLVEINGPRGSTSGGGGGDANENFKFLETVGEYIKDISTLFLDDFIIDPQLVILLCKDMDSFNKQLNQFRPVERLSKGIRFPFGILYPDVTFLPSYLTAARESEPIFCVEIKPKQGWRFDACANDLYQFQRLFQLEDQSLLAKCRYCAMQHLKYKKGKSHSLSNYCPMDLYSGEIPKMTKAIKNLIDCPQNNLRIFRNGDQVYGDQQYHNSDRLQHVLEEIFSSKDRQRNVHQFVHLLSNVLLKEYTASGGDGRMEGNLPSNCVLQQILNVQRLVYDFFVAVDLNEVSTRKEDEDAPTCDRIRNRITEELLAESNNKFKKYKYGATALDCSLMITFQKITGSEGDRLAIDDALAGKFLVSQDKMRFMTKIAIMDLDPKPFTHAMKYVTQTQASYQIQSQRLMGTHGSSVCGTNSS